MGEGHKPVVKQLNSNGIVEGSLKKEGKLGKEQFRKEK